MNKKIRMGAVLFFAMMMFGTIVCHAWAKAGTTVSLSKTSTIAEDQFRKKIIGKLGVSHARMDCSHYVNWALNNVANSMNYASLQSNQRMQISIARKSTASWLSHKITAKSQIVQWDTSSKRWSKVGKMKKTNVAKKYESWSRKSTKKQKKSAANLKMGDVLVYRSYGHVALYFGKFDSAKQVAKYLVDKLGYNGGKALKKRTSSGLTAYANAKNKIIIKEYKGLKYSKQWRIHSSTRYGIMIDNDISFNSGRYGGDWVMTVHTQI